MTGRIAALFLVGAGIIPAQTLPALAKAARQNPNGSTLAALRSFAASAGQKPEAGLAYLALGVTEYEQKQAAAAVSDLQTAAERLPTLADYTAYYLALVERDINQSAAIPAIVAKGLAVSGTPLAPQLTTLAVKAWAEQQRGDEALRLVEQQKTHLNAARTDLLTGIALEVKADLAGAARAYERVAYLQTGTSEAKDAEAALARLRLLVSPFPAVTPAMLLARTKKLMETGEPARAQHELEEALPGLTGADRDWARVRIGVAQSYAKANRQAQQTLQALTVSSPEADAERLYYLAGAARRLEQDAAVNAALDQLGKTYPQSPRYRDALVAAGNYYWTQHEMSAASGMFRRCVEAFPRDSQAAGCQWWLAWDAYRTHRPDTRLLLQKHLQAYPQSDKANAALYFLGRLAEASGDTSTAKAYYQRTVRDYPYTFYGVTAARRLGDVKNALAAPAAVQQFLASLRDVPAVEQIQVAPPAAGADWLRRAELLEAAGLGEWAEAELRYGAQRDPNPFFYATQLAQLAQRRGAYDVGIRWIKRLTPDYLNVVLRPETESFWKLAFPLPYREALEANCRAQGLDPFLVAALIRQESEFNPKALSRVNAMGLTQVMPATGRQLSRTVGIGGFAPSLLFDPEVNLRLGTYFLKTLWDRWQDHWEEALAAYNAGPTRVTRWLTWGPHAEPAEFIENIPLAETRGYVQAVLRNAEVYRRLYAPR